MVGSLIAVMVVELMNSAIEAAVDLQGGAIHPLAKKAKDAGSAAVLFAIIAAILVWAAILI